MRINSIGHNHRHDQDFYISRPRGSGDHLLMLIKTPAVFVLDGKEIHTDKNSFILYREGTPQIYRADGEGFSVDWFYFNLTEEDKKFISDLHIPVDTVVPISDISGLSLIIKRMSYEFFSSNLYKNEASEIYLHLFFLKLGEKLQSNSSRKCSAHYDKLAVLRSKIYSSPENDWNVKDIARDLNMSVSHFEHMYKKIFGISVMNEVISSRMEQACLLLGATDLPINQIAERCGYQSDIHFMRQFKARVGMTPTEFRRSKDDVL